MFCPYCGVKVAPGTPRCGKCGTDLPAEIARAGGAAVHPTAPASAPAASAPAAPKSTAAKAANKQSGDQPIPPAADRAAPELKTTKKHRRYKPRGGDLDFPLSTYPGQGVCDLCAAALTSAQMELVSGADMHTSALNGFRGTETYRDLEAKSFWDDADRTKTLWWELCPGCYRRMLPYLQLGWRYGYRFRFALGLLMALVGLAAGLTAFRLWFFTGDLETRIWKGVGLSLGGLLGGGLAGAIVGHLFGRFLDTMQSDAPVMTFWLSVACSGAALYFGWDIPAGAENPRWLWWKAGIGGGAFGGGVIFGSIVAYLVKKR